MSGALAAMFLTIQPRLTPCLPRVPTCIQLVSLFCMLMLITYIPMAELTMQPFACVRGMDREPTPMITHSTLRLLWADTPPSVVQRWSG